MINKVEFDFTHIPDLDAFYNQFAVHFDLGATFGANLDALWDVVTGDIPLPTEIVFTHFAQNQRRRFGSLVLLFEEAEEELDGDLRFNIRS